MVSEKLRREEKTAFKNWVKSQPNKTIASEKLSITRKTLYSVMGSGSGKPDTIAKIREVILN